MKKLVLLAPVAVLCAAVLAFIPAQQPSTNSSQVRSDEQKRQYRDAMEDADQKIAAEIKALFTKADPTADDWNALHARIALKSYAAPALQSTAATPLAA